MDQSYRVGALTIVWTAVVAIVFALAAAEALVGLGGMIIVLSILAAAGAATASIMGTKDDSKSLNDKKSDAGKRKNSDDLSELSSMLALLDEDDAYDVRQRIKQRLMDAVDTGELDDARSFEDLMQQSKSNKR
jgi:hypothetical protein